MGQSVVVENQGGGGTVIGTDYVVRSAPDGHTLLLSGGNVAYISALYRKLAFDVTRDLTPVVLVAPQPSMLVVHPSLPVKSVTQLIALAKSKPEEVRYSSGGSGSASHFAAELFRSTVGIKLLHVPYKGAGPATTALIAGEVHMLVTNIASLLPHMKSGRARALAATKGHLRVGYSRRFKECYLRAKKQMLHGRLGRVVGGTARVYNSRAQAFSILKRSPHATPVLDVLTYYVDLMCWFLEGNRLVEVVARGQHGF